MNFSKLESTDLFFIVVKGKVNEKSREDGEHDGVADAPAKSQKKKPSYAGGLVLEPKKGNINFKFSTKPQSVVKIC